ncbi:hypothetical protein B7P43_G05372 [Cryptotermes secundus]|uniref:Uncharacterized protein n=1 Tax=Cryptotermes secundus TaxID=105785 RepID=A0A2J7PEV7_9NEOP|nr:hypothetical protein B7P43_G05372 [Cryptotermes secundus]
MSKKLSPENSSATSDTCVESDGICLTPGSPVNFPKVGVLSTLRPCGCPRNASSRTFIGALSVTFTFSFGHNILGPPVTATDTASLSEDEAVGKSDNSSEIKSQISSSPRARVAFSCFRL